MKIEKRFTTAELRAEESGGKTFLVGRAASYGVTSHDLGGFREKLAPGCFDDVLSDRSLDCIHTVNHDPNRILGRTTSGTLKLKSDAKGLNYRTELPDTGYADDVAALCRRGDLSSSSFAFTVPEDGSGEEWDDKAIDPDGQRCVLRTISRIDRLHDVSTVASPAYPGTAAGLGRSLPETMPAEIRSRILRQLGDDENARGTCDCDCAMCRGGAHDECDNPDCDSPDCADCPMQEDSRGNRGRRSGDPAAALVQAATDYFSSDAADADKAGVWSQLEQLAAKAGIDTDDEGERSARDRSVALAMAQW